MLSILIVDDHFLIRQGLRQVIGEEFRWVQFGEAKSAAEALALMEQRKWNLVILDNSLPDRPGLLALRDILKRRPTPPVLMLTGHTERSYAAHSMRMGASGWVSKGASRAELVRTIRSSLAKAKSSPPATVTGSEPRHTILSRREYNVMLALGAGRRPTEIASEMKLSAKTISTYRRRLLNKMGLESSADIIRYLIENHLG